VLRKRLGLSQQDLAEKVGLNRGNIASYETGIAEPKICRLLRISSLLRVGTQDLTRLNLNEEGKLEMAISSYTEAKTADHQEVDLRLHRVEEMATVLESVKNLYNYREKDLDLAHPDVIALDHYYEQMQDVAQALLAEQRRILEKLKCSCR
jgi:transcriptional regulator with XRE-family HTH domain